MVQVNANSGFAPVGQMAPPPVAPAPAPVVEVVSEVLGVEMEDTSLMLTEQTGLAKDELAKLMGFMAGPTDEELENQDRKAAGSPYLCFYHSLMGKAVDIATLRPGVQDGDQFIIDGDDIIPLQTGLYTFTILDFLEYWAVIDKDDGTHTEAVFEDPGWQNKRKQQLLAITIIDNGETFYPTVTTFRKAKCGAASKHLTAIRAAKHPDWIGNTRTQEDRDMRAWLVAHTPTMPPIRVWSTLSLSAPKKTEKGSYTVATSTYRPATAAQIPRFSDWVINQGGAQLISDCIESFEHRVKYVKSCQ